MPVTVDEKWLWMGPEARTGHWSACVETVVKKESRQTRGNGEWFRFPLHRYLRVSGRSVKSVRHRRSRNKTLTRLFLPKRSNTGLIVFSISFSNSKIQSDQKHHIDVKTPKNVSFVLDHLLSIN